MWETIARDDDPFVCCNFIPIDVKELQDKGFTFQSKKDVHDFIKQHIIGKQNEELVKVRKHINFIYLFSLVIRAKKANKSQV